MILIPSNNAHCAPLIAKPITPTCAKISTLSASRRSASTITFDVAYIAAAQIAKKSPNALFVPPPVASADASPSTNTASPANAVAAPPACVLAYLAPKNAVDSAIANGIVALSNSDTLVIDVYRNASVTK